MINKKVFVFAFLIGLSIGWLLVDVINWTYPKGIVPLVLLCIVVYMEVKNARIR
jgi:uncharacterized membrane protein YfcA